VHRFTTSLGSYILCMGFPDAIHASKGPRTKGPHRMANVAGQSWIRGRLKRRFSRRRRLIQVRKPGTDPTTSEDETTYDASLVHSRLEHFLEQNKLFLFSKRTIFAAYVSFSRWNLASAFPVFSHHITYVDVAIVCSFCVAKLPSRDPMNYILAPN
jgi:hypothetical protein